jgi:hypothetical protein
MVAQLTALFGTMPEAGYSVTMTYLRRGTVLVILLFALLMPLGLTLLALMFWLYSKKDRDSDELRKL